MNSRFPFILRVSFISVFWVLAIWYLIWEQNFLIGVDPYYHIQISEIMREYGIVLKKFPWADCSIWRDHFFDKEWLFHIFLIPFLSFGKIKGVALATLAMVALIPIVWGYLLKALNVKYITLYLMIGFIAAGYAFPSRLAMCRPHVLSITLLGIVLICMVRNYRIMTLLSIYFYSLAYTGAWQVLGIVFVYDFINIFYEKRFNFKSRLLPYAFTGIILGLIINPYFPNNLYGLYVQNIIVLQAKWFGYEHAALNLGNELNALDPIRLFTQFLPYFIVFVITLGLAIRDIKKNKPVVTAFGAIALVYFCLTLMSFRFVEYSTMLVAVFVGLYWDKKIYSFLRNSKLFKLLLIGFYCFLFSYSISIFLKIKEDNSAEKTKYSEITNWLNSKTKPSDIKELTIRPKDVVFTGGWDDAPALFFGAPQYKYLVFLDPTFMYINNPRLYKQWKRIADGKVLDPEFMIKKEFNAKYIFLTRNYTRLTEILDKSPYVKLSVKDEDNNRLYSILINDAQLKEYEKKQNEYINYLKDNKVLKSKGNYERKYSHNISSR